MSLKVFILFVIALSIQMTKGAYTCGEHLATEICFALYYFPDDTGIYYVKPCKKGYFCDTEVFEDMSRLPVCNKLLALSGENKKCFNSADCGIGICVNGKCKIVQNGEKCYYDEQCGEKSFCNEDMECESMKVLGESCSQSSQCEVGFECINSICGYIFKGENGDIVDNEKACKSGFTIEENDEMICATFQPKSLECDSNHTCFGTVDVGNNEKKEYNASCVPNWADKYICPSKRNSSFLSYVDAFSEAFITLKDFEKNRIINRYTLNKPVVTSFLLDFQEYYRTNGASDCVRYFFYRQLEFSTFISISSVFYILILIF